MLSSLDQQFPKTDEKHWEREWLEDSDFKPILQHLLSDPYIIVEEAENASFTIIDNGNGNGNVVKTIFITSGSGGYYKKLPDVISTLNDGEDAICLHQVNGNHWVALNVKKEANNNVTCIVANSLPQYYTRDKDKISFPEKPPNSSRPFTADNYTYLKNVQEWQELYSKNVDVMDATYYAQIEYAISENGGNNFAGNITLQDWQTEYQQNTWDCGIFTALNAVDMLFHTQHCTNDNVANTRQWFCEYKAEEAQKEKTEAAKTQYEVGNDLIFRLSNAYITPSQKDAQSSLENSLKQFYYQDTTLQKDKIDKLETEIKRHEDTITKGLIAAAEQVWSNIGGLKLLQKIIETWNIAKNADGKGLHREKPDNTTEEEWKQMKRFSALFQKQMHKKNLMTGNENPKQIVGMRLKRVHSHFIDVLKQKLKQRSQLNCANLPFERKLSISSQINDNAIKKRRASTEAKQQEALFTI